MANITHMHTLTGKKICTNTECKEKNPQPLGNFHRNKNHVDGHMNQCKSCRKEYNVRYRATQAYKDSQKKYKRSPKGILANRTVGKRYRNSERGKHRSKTYWQEYKNNPKNTGKIKARGAISSAVSAGKLPRVSSLICVFCTNKAENYHHHSYDEQYYLSVIPVCELCHKRLHNESNFW
jgi:hypothetical protein